MKINKWIEDNRPAPTNPYVPERVPRFKCADGFSMSIQADKCAYCTPRTNEGPWASFEIGHPSEKEELLMEYVDGDGSEWETVYGYVPSEVIRAVIAAHGGPMDQ
jgi:hypothetical protein